MRQLLGTENLSPKFLNSGFKKMFNINKYLASIICSLLLVSAPSAIADPVDTLARNYYEEGEQYRENGEYKKALNTWLQARNVLHGTDIDPRIGFSFIDLVTERELTQYYKVASIMYYWGLSGTPLQKFEDPIKREIRRLKPLVADKQYDRWMNLADEKNEQVTTELKKFWTRLDPTLTTAHNERLLEHWERIQYARNNFRKDRSTAYSSDERGLIYVKYGAPDRIRDGSFDFNTLQVGAWAEDMTLLNMNLSRASGDTVSSASAFRSNMNSAENITKNLTSLARDYFNYADYEIWIYERYQTDSGGNNLIFIFGKDAASGDFGLRRSLEEFIPSRAFRPSQRRGTNINTTPGLLLQLLMYEQAAAIDDFFGNSFMDMESQAMTMTDPNPYMGIAERSKNEFELTRIQEQAPEHTSTYREELPTIELEIQQYRMLDPENKPYYTTFVYSSPFNILLTNYARQQQGSVPQYELVNTVHLRDGNWNLLANVSDRPPLFFGRSSLNASVQPVQSVFILPYIGEEAQQIISTELYNRDAPASDTTGSIFSGQLKGINKKTLPQPDPLSTDTGELEMADLIFGYDDNLKSEKIPFFVPREKILPPSKNMMVHFEVYHLSSDPSGIARFTVEYEVRPKRGLNLLRSGDPEVRLLLNYETDKSYFAENLEIETRELSEGSYTLALTVNDIITGQQTERNLQFEIQ